MVVAGPGPNNVVPDLGGNRARIVVGPPLPDGHVSRRRGNENGKANKDKGKESEMHCGEELRSAPCISCPLPNVNPHWDENGLLGDETALRARWGFLSSTAERSIHPDANPLHNARLSWRNADGTAAVTPANFFTSSSSLAT